ncbi:MAG: DUF3575 domain-containing protein [Chitinophagaceae bacterium]|jgi:hypothetical protein|nr:DUF3575 domain-containing protein [Chitinophagaceae bacterium]MBP6046761.1 DUF3575 domain-containing protein [Ferruginibacter sp.]MBK7089695.1 DUF3575 domain-containing protein [Chitinophagaceae bacterium]MBK7347425.1 DUF3575 domain-containing protein [Chitinophagaceae bacterium]MBK7734072.1 DUF3575 domain-containing protein [Chitinophagaceae bacterium]
MSNNKLFFFALFGLLVSTQIFAQEKENKSKELNNIVKINLGSIAVKNIALQYERAVGKKISVAMGVRFQPYGTIPFKSVIEDQVDEPDVKVGDMKLGNIAISPEFRYYFGKKALRGFYVAPYVRYANFKTQTPINYTSGTDTKTAFFKGNISSISGGILFGSQFKLSKNFVLDWWILGGHFGSSNGNLKFTAALSPSDQADLKSTLDDLDLPLFKIKYEINDKGGTISSKGAWAGFRGFGLNLGYRF